MNSDQKRVLHVLSGMNRGGAETMVMNLYRKMDKSKVQFDFLTYRNDPCAYDEEILSLGGRLFYVPSIGQSNPLTFVRNVRNAIKENGPFSAVHAHTDFQTGFIALAARLAGVPVRVCHSHNTSWKTGFNWKDRLRFARVQAAHFGKCDSAVCLRRGCGQVFIWTVQYGAGACSPSS
nr:glycosyltransferase [Bacillus subtilis]